MKKEFKEYIESFGAQKDKLKYWIDKVVDPVCRHSKYRVEAYDLNDFRLWYEVNRLRNDPLFPDYDSWTYIPIEYMEAGDYKAYADQYVFETKQAEKAKLLEAKKEWLKTAQYEANRWNKEVKRLQNELS